MDPNTQSNFEEINIFHLHLDLSADFDNSILKGHVILSGEALKEVSNLNLDVRNLEIGNIILKEPSESKLDYKVHNGDSLGSKLEISLPNLKKSTKLKVQIDFQTTKNSEALQFLSPEQTVGKKYPYLFSQSQAIHARSFFPCMDTPSVKQTYTSSITCVKPLVAVMSALSDGMTENEKSQTFHFKQPIPIPVNFIDSFLELFSCYCNWKH